MSIARDLLADFETEVAHTRKILEAVPEDRLDWQPHEKSMTLGQLAGHVAENPSWVGGMLEPELDFAAMAEEYKPFVATSRSELLENFEANVRQFAEAVSGRDDEFLQQTWTARMGDKVIMSMPRHTAFRSTAIHHWIHHRGQLTVYLRLLNVPVPPTYGPTADFPDFG